MSLSELRDIRGALDAARRFTERKDYHTAYAPLDYALDHVSRLISPALSHTLRRELQKATTREDFVRATDRVESLISALSISEGRVGLQDRRLARENEALVERLAAARDELAVTRAQLETLVSVSPKEHETVSLESLSGKDVLFSIMPFDKSFDDVWNGAIKRASTGAGLTPIRVDMITKSTDITDDIVSLIKQARAVVIDLTGQIPNVMFEAGYALALKKEYVFISQSVENLPFDIKTIRTIPYKNTWQGIEELHKELEKFIKTIISVKKKAK